MNPKFIVEQKITAFVNKYAVYKVNPDGSKGQLLALAQQKRLAFKEKVTFYSDEAKTNAVFSFRAEKVMDIHGRFLVEDPQGQLIGGFKKEFKKSLLNSTWNILDKNDQPTVKIYESSTVLAVLRRILGFVPYVGELLDIIIGFFRYHFVFADISTGQAVGRYQKTTLFRDHYTLSMADEAYAREDWRVLASMAVALDALQSR